MRPARFSVDPHILDNSDLSKVEVLRHWQHQISVLLEQLQKATFELPLTPSSTLYLNGQGQWSTPSATGGAGDMTKAVYDTNNNGVVDTCDSLAWSKLTGVPSTFPPSTSLTDLGSPAGNSTINTAQAYLIVVNLAWTTAANWTLTLQNVALGSDFHLRFLNSSGATRTFTITATNPSAATYTIAVYVPGSNALTGALSINSGEAINLRGVSYTVGGNPTIQLFGFGSTG